MGMVAAGSCWPTCTSLIESTAWLICSLPRADDDGRGGRAYRLAPDGGQLGASGDHGVATCRLDRVNRQHADDLVTGSDRTVVDESLLPVDKPIEVDPGLRVHDELPFALLGNHDGECGRGDHVAVAASTGLHLVDVNDVVGAHSLGELADLLPAHRIGRGGRIDTPGETCIDGHGDHPRRCTDRQPTESATTAPANVAETAVKAWDQRVSR